MDKHTVTSDELLGIKIYTEEHANGGGRKRRAMAKGMQKTRSKTSMLASKLPSNRHSPNLRNASAVGLRQGGVHAGEHDDDI